MKSLFLTLTSLLTFSSASYATVTDVQFFANSLGENRTLRIYTPPGYDPQGSRNYPVIYFLHGSGGDHTGYPTFENRLEFLINGGDIQPVIGVKPNGSGCGPQGAPAAACGWVNSINDGNFEDFVVQDVVDYTEANYKVVSDRSARAIMGHSMGGFGAMHIALKHPAMFAGVASMSGYLNFQDFIDQYVPQILNVEHPGGPPYTFTPNDGFFTWAFFVWGSGFSPNPANPPYNVDFPLGSNGAVIQSVMDRWFDFDPAGYAVNLPPQDAPAIYVDSASSDEFLFHPFSLHFVDVLIQEGIPHTYNEFATNHNGLMQPRMRAAVEFLGLQLGAPVDVEEVKDVRSGIALSNYPNPVRDDGTTFSIGLEEEEGQVSLEVYDVRGRLVDSVMKGKPLSKGLHRVPWQARVSSGVYFYKLKAGHGERNGRLIVAR